MQAVDDLLNLFSDVFPEAGQWPFLSQEQPPATNLGIYSSAPSIPPEIRITHTTSNDSTNVDGSSVHRYPEACSALSAIASDTNFVTPNRESSHFSSDSHLSSSNTNLNLSNTESNFTQVFQLPVLPWQQNMFSPLTPKLLDIGNETEVPLSLLSPRQSATTPLTAQTTDSSALLFADQHSFLTAGDNHAPSGQPLVMPRRNSLPQILITSGLVASPSLLSTTWIDERTNGDQFNHVEHLTPGGDRKKRRYIFSSRLN